MKNATEVKEKNKLIEKQVHQQAVENAKEKLKQQEFFDPTYDAPFKKIFRIKENIIHFLNAILHLERANAIVSVKRLSPGIRLVKQGKQSKNKTPLCTCFDIHAKTADSRFIDVEQRTSRTLQKQARLFLLLRRSR
jgi:hypothetical protein